MERKQHYDQSTHCPPLAPTHCGQLPAYITHAILCPKHPVTHSFPMSNPYPNLPRPSAPTPNQAAMRPLASSVSHRASARGQPPPQCLPSASSGTPPSRAGPAMQHLTARPSTARYLQSDFWPAVHHGNYNTFFHNMEPGKFYKCPYKDPRNNACDCSFVAGGQTSIEEYLKHAYVAHLDDRRHVKGSGAFNCTAWNNRCHTWLPSAQALEAHMKVAHPYKNLGKDMLHTMRVVLEEMSQPRK